MSLAQLSDREFQKQVLQSAKPVVIDFWAPWCGPCQKITPILEKLSKEYKDKLKIYKLNIDENQAVATKYQILSIPTLLFFKKGKVAAQLAGVRSAADIRKAIDSIC
jgi:thioredoxin